MGLYGNYYHYLIENSMTNYSYKRIEKSDKDTINIFKKYSKEILNGSVDMSTESISKYIRVIYFKDELIGFIGLRKATYKKIRYLGVSNFMILPQYQSNGHGSNIIKDIINKNKSNRDEIFCYVEKDNTRGVNFYQKIANVDKSKTYGEDDDLYYVCLYKR